MFLVSASDPFPGTNNAEALQIDLHKHSKTTVSKIRAGDRKYLEKKALHLSTVFKSKAAIEATSVGLTPAQMDESMDQPLRAVGYGKMVTVRKRNHAAHRSSNFLMNLLEAICAVFPNRLGGDLFVMKFEVIFLMWKASQCMLAEEMFDAIAQSNADGGRGFCQLTALPAEAHTARSSDVRDSVKRHRKLAAYRQHV